MNVRLSRILICVEIVLVLLPVTLYSLFYGFVIAVVTFEGVTGPVLFPAVLFALASLAAGWVLSLRFLYRGPAALKGPGSDRWFAVAGCGVVIAAVSGAVAYLRPEWPLSVFVLGSPAALLFLHLALERWLRPGPPG